VNELDLTSITRHYFGNKSFQSITCIGTDNQTRTTKRQNMENKTTEDYQSGPSKKRHKKHSKEN